MNRLATIARRALRYELHAFWRSRPVSHGTILYESFGGSGLLDNPEAIFREILATPDLEHFRHIWVLNDLSPRHPARLEFEDDDRVSFVRRGSPGYYRALATAEFLVNNATFPPEFSKRAGQVYLNTWHGTPLKTMGYDMPNGALEAANTMRNFVSADLLLAQNDFMTERMYERAYRLDGHFRGVVVEEGYPRVDRQQLSDEDRRRVVDLLESRGLSIAQRRVVLYAPTWKGTSFSDPRDDVRTLVGDVAILQEQLGDEFLVLLKTHQVVARFTRSDPSLRDILVPNDIPTNLLLGVAETLITDYSSVFVDFLSTGRPIVFYTPHADDYAATRGTYFGEDELPGVVTDEIRTVADAILDPSSQPDSARRAALRDDWQHRFASDAIGTSAKRVVDVVFRGLRVGYRVRHLSVTTRTSILIHLGALWSNGITSSALNLLEALPSERFDVSVVFNRTASEQLLVNQARIPSSVRQFARDGGMNGSKVTHLRRRLLERACRAEAHTRVAAQKRLWDDEWRRCFGDSRFDHVIDFSGYGPFWATLMLHAPGARSAIWLHNDLVAEVDRLVNGQRRMRRTLPAVFSLYHQFDALVAVSASLAEINQRRLTPFTRRPLAVGVARNLLDPGRDAARAAVGLAGIDYPPPNEGVAGVRAEAMPEWARLLGDKGETVWFVTVGRFSEEKNQARLIRSFALVHERQPQARLLLVGHGALRDDLVQQIEAAMLGESAVVVGPLTNPLPVMQAADCFVLSSRYEGQPMVLLEAAALRLPIVSVDFETVRDALPAESIHVVAQDDAALAEGMLAFLRGDVPASELDEIAYNRESLAEFFTATGIPPAPADHAVARGRP